MNLLQQIKELCSILLLGIIDGTTIIASATGFFTFTNIPVIAFVFLAGPIAILIATLLTGNMFERVLVSAISGIIATIALIITSAFGPKILQFVNISVLRFASAFALVSIALLMINISIPKRTPLFIVFTGIVLSILMR